jgi:UDP-N-acetylglucosamine--N-acetylmuramyl-(pentapeptide) pyrophosphoryl-undecaprenol N-acetylglucosamine transferase
MRNQLRGSISRKEAAEMFGLDPDKKTILAVGGSLGARTINITIRQSFDLLQDRQDIQVLWQIGKLYATQYLDTPTAKLSQVKASVYIDRMDMAYAIADIVIARAGAMTISELCLTGKAAILIPSPYVAEDHQTHNESLTHLGAAVLVPDAEAPGAFGEALRLLDIRRISITSKPTFNGSKPRAGDEIADIIIRIAKTGKR